jgi:acetylornithine/succinyldiaminopimelate/putrescine aminotransferase
LRDRAVQALCDFTEMHTAFLVNSGAEANEAALKIARKATGRQVIVAFEQGFHGRSMACLGVTAAGSYRAHHEPVHGTTRFVPYGDAKALEAVMDGSTAAILVEPIQGIAGVIEPPPGFLSACRRVCDEVGALLIVDEIQTGIGRCGRAMQWHAERSCAPDIATVGKSLGSGFPVAAMLCTEAMASTVAPGEHGSTFGGGPLACAVVEAVLGAIRDEQLFAAAQALEAIARERGAAVDGVTAVRGAGCLLGVVLDVLARPVARALLEVGFLTGTATDPRCLRLCPPAILPPETMHAFFDALTEVLNR